MGNRSPHAALTRLPAFAMMVAASLVFATTSIVLPAAAMPPEPIDPCERVRPGYCGVPSGSFSKMTRRPGGVDVTGTANDPDAPGPVQVKFLAGGVNLATLWTIGTSFSGTIPAVAGTQVCAIAINRNDGRDQSLGCRAITMAFNPIGAVDDVSPGPYGVRVSGWGIDPDTAGSIDVHIYLDGVFAAARLAGANRPDIASAYPAYGAAHGYDVLLAASAGSHSVCVYGINIGAGTANTQLGCRTVIQGAPPAVPTLRLHRQPTGSITVQYFDNSSTEDGFSIERAGSTSGPWIQVKAGGSLAAPYFYFDDYGVTPGQYYCYRVNVWNMYGSSLSPVACATSLLPALPKPTNISASAITQTSLRLDWTDNASGETGYVINRSNASTITLPGTPGTGPMSHVITGLTAGTNYCFEIAPTASGHGSSHATFCATTESVPPPKPVGVKSVQMWNCEGNSRSGTAWYLDHTTGSWVDAGPVPSSWTEYGCGPAITRAAADIDLPDQHLLTLVLVIVDGKYCTADDPSQSACRHWEFGPMLGDANGPTQGVVIG